MKMLLRFDIVEKFIREHKFVKNEFCRYCVISVVEFEKMQHGDTTFYFDSLCKMATFMDIDIFEFFMPYAISCNYN